MESRTGERSQNSRRRIEETLEKTHRHVCRAGFLVVTMIVKRRLWRSNVKEAVKHLEAAVNLLRRLYD